jgi:hypothetical protein
MLHFILGAIITFVGFLFVAKTEWFLENFGRISFFEEHLGSEGGSRLGYKLLGIIIIFIGTLIMTGLIGGFMRWILSPLIKYSQPR